MTLDDVIYEAHVGKRMIYRYFKDKDDLFLRTAINGFDELCGVLDKAAPGRSVFSKELVRPASR